jgi:hypothetical protein
MALPEGPAGRVAGAPIHHERRAHFCCVAFFQMVGHSSLGKIRAGIECVSDSHVGACRNGGAREHAEGIGE